MEQVFAIPGGAQAKVEDMSRALLSHVSQIPGKSFFQQVTSGSNQPLADFGKKLAVSVCNCNKYFYTWRVIYNK